MEFLKKLGYYNFVVVFVNNKLFENFVDMNPQ